MTENVDNAMMPSTVTIPDTTIEQLQTKFPGLTDLKASGTGVQVDLVQLRELGKEMQPTAQRNIRDSLTFLESAKTELGGEDSPLYQEMLQAFGNFYKGGLDTAALSKKFIRDFRDYPTIIDGLQTFIPEGWKMEIISDGSKRVGKLTTADKTIEFLVDEADT